MKISRLILIIFFVGAFVLTYRFIDDHFTQATVLKRIIARLEADSRAAQVLVTDVHFDEKTKKNYTTIKFLEFDSKDRPMEPKYFTFSGNKIQFQSLVIRFEDIQIRHADKLRGKSAYLFLNVFLLDGPNTQVYPITKVNEIPGGYKLDKVRSILEKRLWENFWKYAFEYQEARKMGIKNVQIEAPGTIFKPGTLYTIKIEHDGGLRIDSQSLPEILKGERIK